MLPVIAIVGCPNVGKSTLFNRLTRSRSALVADESGVTRDRQYGYANINTAGVMLIDTGGVISSMPNDDKILNLVAEQTMQAVSEADLILWLVDARAGVTTGDTDLAELLRTQKKPVFLIVNKTDDLEPELAVSEFHSLAGFNTPIPISAKSNVNVKEMLSLIRGSLPENRIQTTENTDAVKIAIIGRPNVGKSTLVNRMIGEERMLTFDSPGTTRDSIFIPFRHRQTEYVLIDTAGIRRKHKVTDKVEKFSIVKSLKAIALCQIVVLVLDAKDAISDQDQTLLGIIRQSGKSLIIAINKWDGLAQEQKFKIGRQFSRKINFIDYACEHRISALHGTGVGKLFKSINKITQSKQRTFKSSVITGFLNDAITATPPPLAHGRRIKLRYAHSGGHDPVRIIIHGNQTQSVPANYQRYLASYFRKRMRLIGTPVFIEFKFSESPYRGMKNTLTKRQTRKRRRLIRHAKSKK